MKTKKENQLNFEMLTETIIMILLVLTMPIVYSKLTTISEEQIQTSEKQIDIIDNISNKVISFFDLIPTAKAQALYGCCKGTTSGACRLTTDQASCNEMSGGIGTWASGKTCNETDFCKPGWCSNGETCGPNTPKWLCLNYGGTFIETESAANELCEKSCCELNGSTAYVTGQQCNLLGGSPEYISGSTDFEKEINCMMEATQYPQGCCISSTGCQYTNSKACSGIFNNGKFCSQISQCNVQAKQGSTCYNGELYYTDNAGNKEELKQNCTQSNLQCENNKCVDMSCRDLILPNSTHVTMKNMESICVYDQKVPSLFSNTYDESWGQTAVGSRHWVWRCINGKVEIEGCEDYRAGICAQVDIDESSAVFNYAKCIQNLGDACYGMQTQTDCENLEKTSGQCYWLGKDERIKNILGYVDLNNKDENDNYLGSGLLWETCTDEDSKGYGIGACSLLNFNNLAGFKQENSEKEKSYGVKCIPKYPQGIYPEDPTPSYYFGDVFVAVEQKKGEADNNWPCMDNCEVGGIDYKGSSASNEMRDYNSRSSKRELLWAELMTLRCSALGDSGIKTNLIGNVYPGIELKSKCELGEDEDWPGDCAGDREDWVYWGTDAYSWNAGEVIGGQDIGQTKKSGLIQEIQNLGNDKTKIYSLENANFNSQKDKFWSFTGFSLYIIIPSLITKLYSGTPLFSGSLTGIFISQLLAHTALAAIAAAAAYGITYAICRWAGMSTADAKNAAGGAAIGSGITTLILLSLSTGPVGWAAAGIIALVAFVGAVIGLLTGTDARYITSSFSCLPYSPPAGSASCELCNKDPLRPCSEYRCWSLGADCEFKSEFGAGSDNEIVDGEGQCIAGNASDNYPPTITSVSPMTTGFSLRTHQYTPSGNFMGYADIGGTLYRFDYLALNIKTNEKAICRWSQNPTRFSNMPIGNGLDNLFPNKYQTDHTKTFSGILVPMGETNLTLYIACTDTNGNENELPFKIFVGASSTDVVPPSITGTSPRNGGSRWNQSTSVNLLIYLNEQVEGCKWAQTDIEYSIMSNAFNNCNAFIDGKISCNATIPFNGQAQDNKYYFRCKDMKGNANNYGYEYILHPCGAINITETSPGGTIESCSTLWNVTLSIKTEGGSEEGISTCYYTNGSGILEQFDYTNSYEHSSRLTLPAGSYNYPILCIDESGNADQKTISFNIVSNINPPEITRIYKEGSNLVIQTNKEAKCYYSKTNQGFTYNGNISDVIQFASNDYLVHRTGWINEIYYVKCQDLCGNGAKSSDIPIIIYPQDFT